MTRKDTSTSTPVQDQVMHPNSLRKLIGILGMLFPFALPLGAWFMGCGDLQGSVSDYYHTSMGGVFVGFLCAYAMFLFAYMGYDKKDIIASKIAGFCALGIAMFPTRYKFDGPTDCTHLPWFTNQFLHMTFTCGFFLTLIYMCLFLFTKTDVGIVFTEEKVNRNRIYRFCGYGMLVSLILILIYIFLAKNNRQLASLKLMFWLEGFALLLFGISWLVKGEAILKDK